MTTGGGAYYATAVALRAEAAKAREKIPAASGPPPAGSIGFSAGDRAGLAPAVRECGLIFQAVGLELAAALWGVAQAIEDAGWRGHARPVERST